MSDDSRDRLGGREDLIGRWSIEKLHLLKKYLSAYVKILSHQRWCKGYEYIDAFAGTGKPRTRDEQLYVDGSPRVALSLTPPFTQYHFIEQSDWRIGKLETVRKEFPNLNIAVYHGDCNRVLQEQILPQLPTAAYKRAIAFIDPFGMSMHWDTMKILAGLGTVEAFINVPVMAVNRSVLKKNPEAITEQDRGRMERFWGGGDWFATFYKEEPTLFGPERNKTLRSGLEFGLQYRKRLMKIFSHCTEPILMTNSVSTPLYCILFAGHNPTGVRIAGDIFKRHLAQR